MRALLLLLSALLLLPAGSLARDADADATAALALARAARERKTAAITVEPPPSTTLTVVPVGMHAHRRTDGTVFVHGDENLGDPVAHAGVERPWPKIATAGQAIPSAPSIQFVSPTSTCPGGNCPQQIPQSLNRWRLFR